MCGTYERCLAPVSSPKLNSGDRQLIGKGVVRRALFAYVQQPPSLHSIASQDGNLVGDANVNPVSSVPDHAEVHDWPMRVEIPLADSDEDKPPSPAADSSSTGMVGD